MIKKVKKKNFYWSLFTIMMVALLGVGISACGGGDDDGDPGNGPENNGPSNPNGGSDDDEIISIVGSTWKGVDGRESLTLTFKSENAGSYVYNYIDSYSGEDTETGTFTYAKESDTKYKIFIKLKENYSGPSEDVLYCVIEGGTMRLYEDDYYDDLEWVLSNNDKNTTATDIIGTWKGKDEGETLTLVFNSKTTGTYDYRYVDSYSGVDQTETGTFTCKPESNSKGVIVFDDHDNDSYDNYSGYTPGVLYYVIIGETLSLYYKDYYHDLEYVLTKQ